MALSARDKEDTRGELIAAARRCFTRFGVHRTRMQDIAQEAGVSKPTLYRYVAGRGELVELALLEKSRELGAALSAGTEQKGVDIELALVDAIVAAVLFTREDAEFAMLTDALGRVPLIQLLAGGAGVHMAVEHWLDPLLRRAQEQHALRADVTLDEIVGWIQGVLVLLTPLEGLDGPALRDVLVKFLSPVVFRNR